MSLLALEETYLISFHSDSIYCGGQLGMKMHGILYI